MMWSVHWDSELVGRLDVAFNESQVRGCGLQFDPSKAHARLFVEVSALPEAGPLDPDPRRVIVFVGVSVIEVILRAENYGVLGPVLPLVQNADAMYGWSFIDVSDPKDRWNVAPSLRLRSESEFSGVAPHDAWFTECGRPGSTGSGERYLLQGVSNRSSGRALSLRLSSYDGYSLIRIDRAAAGKGS